MNPNLLAEVADSLKEYPGESLDEILMLLRKIGNQTKKKFDPITNIQKKLKTDPERLKQIEEEVTNEIKQIINKTFEIKGGLNND